jgi:hypothetical protein
LLDALGHRTTPENVIRTLEEGAKHDLFDQLIHVGDAKLFVDYDGGHYHTANRLDRDESKSLDCLNAHANAVVLRVRVGAPELRVEHPRLVVVHVDKAHTGRALKAVCRPLSKVLPTVKRLSLVTSSRKPVLEAVFHDVVKALDRKFAKQLSTLERFVGSKAAKKLRRVHGVVMLLERGTFVASCASLQAEFHLSTDQLVSFMTGGVAARLESPGFVDALKSLKAEHGQVTRKRVRELCSRMSKKRRS